MGLSNHVGVLPASCFAGYAICGKTPASDPNTTDVLTNSRLLIGKGDLKMLGKYLHFMGFLC